MKTIVLLAAAMSAGCVATAADLDRERESGVTVKYPATAEKSLATAEAILLDEFDVVSPGTSPRSLRAVFVGSWGTKTFFGVWVEPAEGASSVTALSLSQGQLFVPLTEGTFHALMAERLNSR